MGTRNPSLYSSSPRVFIGWSHQHRGPGRLHSTCRSPFAVLFSMGTGFEAPQLISIHTCRLHFSRLSPALHSALLWIMPGFGRFEGEHSTSWHTPTALRWISCRSFDADANMHVTTPRCLVASDQANRSKEAVAVIVDKLHAYADPQLSDGRLQKDHGHAVKVKPTTREALLRAVWWLTPSKKPRSEFRDATHASQTLSL